MNEDYVGSVNMSIRNNAEATLYLLQFAARTTVMIYQALKRWENEKLISKGYIEDFCKFKNACKDRYSIETVPITHAMLKNETYNQKFNAAREEYKMLIKSVKHEKDNSKKQSMLNRINKLNEQFGKDKLKGKAIPTQTELKKLLSKYGIHYSILPVINEDADLVQICVFNDDKDKYHKCMSNYIQQYLSGGEKNWQELKNLTFNDCSIINLPDQAVQIFVGAFEKYKITYAEMPDLDFSDGLKQIMIPNKDLDMVRQLYQGYRNDCLNKGYNDPGGMNVTGTKGYDKTGEITVEDYLNQSEGKFKETSEKYDNENLREDIVDQMNIVENKIGKEHDTLYEELASSDKYVRIFVANSLTNRDVSKSLSEEFPDSFFGTMPGTYGNNEEVLQTPKKFAFINQNETGYFVFLKKDEKPIVHKCNGGFAEQYQTGLDVLDHFNDFTRKRKAAAEEQAKYITKDTVLNTIDVPKPSPIKSI
jgi:hypothetical protein